MKKRFIGRDKNVFDEIDKMMMRSIQLAFMQAMPQSELPNALKMNEDFSAPCQVLENVETSPKHWWLLLVGDMFNKQAWRMISDICDNMQKQQEEFYGPYYCFCAEFLDWITSKLSHETSTEASLEMIKKRLAYLDKMIKEKIFSSNTSKSQLLIRLHTILLEKIVPQIHLGIDSTRLRESLEIIHSEGASILKLGFEIIYYGLSDTENLPPADLSRFSLSEAMYSPVMATRAGQLLQTLIQSPGYRSFFHDEQKPAALTILAENPFLRGNRVCIPDFLRQGISCDTMSDYFYGNVEHKVSAGISRIFREDSLVLASFVKVHALLYEMAEALRVCETIDLLNIGGILVFADCLDETEGLIKRLNKLQELLHKCQSKLATQIYRHYAVLVRESKMGESQCQVWLNNFESINGMLSKFALATDICSRHCKLFISRVEIIRPTLLAHGVNKRSFVDAATVFNNRTNYLLSVNPSEPHDAQAATFSRTKFAGTTTHFQPVKQDPEHPDQTPNPEVSISRGDSNIRDLN